MKQSTIVFLGIIAVLFIAAAGFLIQAFSQNEAGNSDAMSLQEPAKEIVRIGDVAIPVEIADTPDERRRGLSGRLFLASDQGMLFIFPQSDYYGFWMPDMHFPIDIVWIGEGLRVVGIHENVLPLEPGQGAIWYYPPQPVRYVLEVNAGFAASRGIRVGDPVMLPQPYNQ